MADLSSETLHASCVAIGDRAVLIEGRSGAGKSDLTLRLIDRGAILVSDDYTVVKRSDGSLFASPPATIAGKIEVRGIGVVDLAYVADVPVALLVNLDDPVERLPDHTHHRLLAGVEIPLIALAALEPSATIKVEYALRRLGIDAA